MENYGIVIALKIRVIFGGGFIKNFVAEMVVKIDIFTHFVPPRYRKALTEKVDRNSYMMLPLELTPAI